MGSSIVLIFADPYASVPGLFIARNGLIIMEHAGCTRFCQSCAIPMPNDSLLGTNSDGTLNPDYCRYCYDNGRFLQDVTMEEFIELCVPLAPHAGMTEEQMRDHCTRVFPALKRWKRA